MDWHRRRCVRTLGGHALATGALCAATGGAQWAQAAAEAASPALAPNLAAETRAPVHALLIGCGRYTGLGPSQQLPGVEPDVSLMRRALLAAYGDRLSMRVLDSADAADPPTHRAVLQAMDTWSARTPEGALAWLYVAGHGTRRPQPQVGNTYREPDGADEFFLPMDSGRWQDGSVTVARSIRDDEIHQHLARLQQRGVQVVAWFDTCHAAGMDRGSSRPVSPAAPGLIGTRARAVDISLLGGPSVSTWGSGRRATSDLAEREARRGDAVRPAPRDLSRLALLYACRKHEQAFEGWVLDAQGRRLRHGWFTWHALRAWQTLRASGQPWTMAHLQQRITRAYEAQGILGSHPQLLGDVTALQ